MLYRAKRAVVLHDYFPSSIDYPTARPAMVLRDLGWEVHAVDLAAPPQPTLEGMYRWSEGSRGTALRRVAALRPELLLLEGWTWMMAALPFARRTWVRVTAPSGRRLGRVAQQRLLYFAAAVSFLNPWEESRWKTRHGALLDLPHPVDIEFWSEPVDREATFWASRGLPPPRGQLISYVAQIMARKRQAELVDALAPLLTERPDLTLAFAGWIHEEAEEAATRAAIARYELDERVILLGNLDPADVRQLYAWTDVHAINTTSEMECMVLYESLAARRPTVIPELPELTSAFPGLLAHHTQQELLANVRRLLDEPGLAEAQVRAAQQRLAWADVRRHDANIEAFVARVRMR